MGTQLGLYKRNHRDLNGYENSADPSDPNTFYRRSQSRFDCYDSASDTGHPPLATGVLTLVPIYLAAGDVITKIGVASGATAAGTPTNYWFELRSPTGAILRQTADQLTTAWAANTVINLALATTYTVPNDGIYEVGIMVKATTVPSLLGSLVAPSIVTGERALVRRLGSSLAVPADSPATTSGTTAAEFAPYVVLS